MTYQKVSRLVRGNPDGLDLRPVYPESRNGFLIPKFSDFKRRLIR
jgi:hypothetical protein